MELLPCHIEILIMVGWGYTDRQIAEELSVQVKTLTSYFSRIRKILGVPESLCEYVHGSKHSASRVYMLLYALKQGKIKLEDIDLPEE